MPNPFYVELRSVKSATNANIIAHCSYNASIYATRSAKNVLRFLNAPCSRIARFSPRTSITAACGKPRRNFATILPGTNRSHIREKKEWLRRAIGVQRFAARDEFRTVSLRHTAASCSFASRMARQRRRASLGSTLAVIQCHFSSIQCAAPEPFERVGRRRNGALKTLRDEIPDLAICCATVRRSSAVGDSMRDRQVQRAGGDEKRRRRKAKESLDHVVGEPVVFCAADAVNKQIAEAACARRASSTAPAARADPAIAERRKLADGRVGIRFRRKPQGNIQILADRKAPNPSPRGNDEHAAATRIVGRPNPERRFEPRPSDANSGAGCEWLRT